MLRNGVAVLLFILLVHCSSDSPAPPSTATVMVYLIGTDLESDDGNATKNLTEMMQVGSTAQVTILVQTGGTKQWKTPLVSNATAQRFRVRQGTLELLQNLGQVNMGDPATLQDFLIWGPRTFPAQKYFLVLWDHGIGSVSLPPRVGVYGPDELTQTSITLTQLTDAVRGANAATGATFEIIGFDACLMATVELAQALSPVAKFLVASQELAPGDGWDFRAWLQALAQNPAIDGASLGKIIADSFMAKAVASDQAESASGATVNEAQTVTLSVVDLSKVSVAVERLAGLAGRISPTLQTQGDVTLATARLRSEDYANDNENPPDMVDLSHLATNLRPAFQPEADQLLAALSQTVVYRVKGSARPHADGLSVFLPYKRFGNQPHLDTALQEYASLAFSPSYRALVQAFAGIVAADTSGPSFSNVALSGNTFSATVNFGRYPGESYVALTQDDQLAGTSLFLGLVPIQPQAGGALSFPYTAEWLTLNGQLVSFFASDFETTANLFDVPVKINGETAQILVKQNPQTGEFSIIGAWPGVVNGTAQKEIHPIRPGNVIVPQFVRFDLLTDEPTIVDGHSFTVTGPVIVEEAPLSAGTYHLRFYAINFGQRREVSDFVTVNAP